MSIKSVGGPELVPITTGGSNGSATVMNEGSITPWVRALKAGNRAAVQPLWEAYFRRLVGLARARLRATPRRVADEEDVALSAFNSFCRRAEAGRFPRLEDRDDLWQILFVLTVRKAIDQARREVCRGRGAVRVRSLEDLRDLDAQQVVDLEATPDLTAQLTEACHRLLDLLKDDGTLQSVALWKMEGYTNADIAERLRCVETTVERKLQRIRHRWERELGHGDADME
jgi:DNA-directed RNA polymerase specialized sigma24 family protein